MASGFQNGRTRLQLFWKTVFGLKKTCQSNALEDRRCKAIFDANVRGPTFYESIVFGIMLVFFPSLQIWLLGSSKCVHQMFGGAGLCKLFTMPLYKKKKKSERIFLFSIMLLIYKTTWIRYIKRLELGVLKRSSPMRIQPRNDMFRMFANFLKCDINTQL